MVQHKLTQLRNKDTSSKHFRELLRELTFYLGYEATTNLAVNDATVETPVAKYVGKAVSTRVTLIPIMRAGLGMVDAMQDILPDAHVHHIGMFRRGGNNLLPVVYFNKLPAEVDTDVAIVLEPVIATAGTMVAAIDILKEWGVKKIKVICMIASSQGIESLLKEHPELELTVGAIDDTLTEEGIISPGLGDAGDRQFHGSSTPK